MTPKPFPRLDTGTVEALTTYLDARIAELRVKNDELKLDLQHTTDIRARIAELLDLIGKMHPKPSAKPRTDGSGNPYA